MEKDVPIVVVKEVGKSYGTSAGERLNKDI